MRRMFQRIHVNTVNEETVEARTGKSWFEWFKILDKAGARMMDHREIALWLRAHTGLPRWWSRMIAVGYENERGLRGSNPDELPGRRCEVKLNKVVAAPRAAVWAAWQDPGTLSQWLPKADFAVAKTVPQTSMHLDWLDESRVAVRLYEQRGKTRLVVSHTKLSETGAARAQDYWCVALERLRVLMSR